MSINQAAVLREGGVTRFVSSSHVFQIYGAAQGSNLSFDTLVSSASNTTAMTIASTANVGVGTSTPGSKLSVSGGVSVGEYAGSAAPANGLIVSGNVGFGTASPNALVHVEGGALVTGTLTTSNLTVLGSSVSVNAYETISSNVVIDNQSGLGPALHVTQKGLGAQYPVADFYDFDVSTTTPVLRIADGGNVGVGTASPANPLDVWGSISCESIITGNGLSTGAAALEVGGNRTGDGVAHVDFHGTASSDYEARVIRTGGVNGHMNIINTGTGVMTLNTNNAEKVRLDSSGNLGIGTATIGSKLSVNGGVGVGTTYAGTAAPTDSVIVSGKIGVGTTTPQNSLDVWGTMCAGSVIQNGLGISTGDAAVRVGASRTGDGNAYTDFFGAAGAYTARIIRTGGANGIFNIVNTGTGQLQFGTSNIERMRIDGTTGKLGIGTATMGSLLSVNGGVGIGTAYAATAAPTDGLIVSGNVGVGTTVAPVAMSVWGDMRTGAFISTGNGVSTGSTGIEIGGIRTGDGDSYVDFHGTSGADYEARIIRNSGANGNLQFINTGTGVMVMGTSNVERMRLDSSGNLGIGTATAGSKLSVNGGVSVGTYAGTNAPSNGLIVSGGVGIGTTTTSALSQIHATSSIAQMRLTNTTKTYGWDIEMGTPFGTTDGTLCLVNRIVNTAGDSTRSTFFANNGNVSINIVPDASYTLKVGGPTYVAGTFTASSTKSFRIDHPVRPNYALTYACIEGPRVDLIHRGKAVLVNGAVTVNIDSECNTTGGVTSGTFAALCKNHQVFLQNETGFARVKGTISGNVLAIQCESASSDTISWMIVSERKDAVMQTTYPTTSGSLVCETPV